MNNFEIKSKSSLERKESVENDLVKFFDAIEETNIFDDEYLKKVKLVLFEKDGEFVFENQSFTKALQNFNMKDFVQGKRTDFVGIQSKKEFSEINPENLNDKHSLPFLFVEKMPSYEEFVTHEIAHNVFDVEYKKRFGEYQKKNEVTDVTENFRKNFKSKIKKIFEEYYPNLDLNKFSFSRQQISEVFAFMNQREFCKRSKKDFDMHEKIFDRAVDFSKNTKEKLEKFNESNERNCSMEDFYEENHVLSIFLAPILEKEFPNFKERLKLFW